MSKFLKKIHKIIFSKDKCFEEHQINGVCNGLSGGDWFTDYLDWGCVNCPHLTMIVRKGGLTMIPKPMRCPKCGCWVNFTYFDTASQHWACPECGNSSENQIIIYSTTTKSKED